MKQVKTVEDLKRLKDELQPSISLRTLGDNVDKIVQVQIGMSTCGIASGAKDIMEYFINVFGQKGINAVVTQTGCMGYCDSEPMIEVKMLGGEPVRFGHVDISRANEIIEKYILKGMPVDGVISSNCGTIKKA